MTLVFGQHGTDAAAFQLDVTSRRPFPDVLTALRQAIDEAGMKLLHEIDPQGALRSVDQVIGGARLLFFFHPQLLARLLQIDSSAIVEAQAFNFGPAQEPCYGTEDTIGLLNG